jgi:hypothetical protein
LNLAEDISIEVKMIKKDIVRHLISMLDRQTPELLILVITFLRKLSVFKENKDEMLVHSEILAGKLEKLLESSNKPLQSLTLRLILNLSHDTTFRHYFIKHAIFPKLVSMFTGQAFLAITIQVLYQLSIDDKNRGVSGFTECIPYVILNF